MWLSLLLTVLGPLLVRLIEQWLKKAPNSPMATLRADWVGEGAGQVALVRGELFDAAELLVRNRPVGSRIDARWIARRARQTVKARADAQKT